ncbi:MAG: hypothetical protein LBQ43_00715 [Holosporales bacterium]|jgi:hypothetical protein|nr:hypothetical protein [Holosporales bacterium]
MAVISRRDGMQLTRFGEVVHLADGVLALGNNTLATAAAALNALFTKIQEPTQAQITNALFSVGEEPDVDYYVLDPTVIDISLVESMRRRNEELNAELDHIKHDLTTLLRMVGRIMNYTH